MYSCILHPIVVVCTSPRNVHSNIYSFDTFEKWMMPPAHLARPTHVRKLFVYRQHIRPPSMVTSCDVRYSWTIPSATGLGTARGDLATGARSPWVTEPSRGTKNGGDDRAADIRTLSGNQNTLSRSERKGRSKDKIHREIHVGKHCLSLYLVTLMEAGGHP